MGFKAWETPPDFFAALNKQFQFTLDAAASHENALLPRYFTPEGKYERLASGKILHLIGEDGCWYGERIYCNPPYDASLPQWVTKALSREAEVAVLLLPPSVDVKWFHQLHSELVNSRPVTLTIGSHCWRGESSDWLILLFMEGRLKFWRDGKPGKAPRAGNLLAIVRGYPQ